MDIKRQPLHFQQSSENDKNSLKHRWEHLLQTWCPSAASPSWILVLTSSPPHEQLQNSNFTKCRTSAIPNLCGIVALHISVVWETQRKWPRPRNSQFIELSTWAWSNSLLSKISVLCWLIFNIENREFKHLKGKSGIELAGSQGSAFSNGSFWCWGIYFPFQAVPFSGWGP